MDVYSSEQEQLEAIKKWWAENGKSAVIGVILGLSAIFGWRAWQSHIISQAEAASEIYQTSLAAMRENNLEQAKDRATEIVIEYGNTGYAIFAHMLLAYISTQEADYDKAEEQLILARDKTDNDALKNEIKLRLARVYTANNKLDQALAVLNSGQEGKFSAQYKELKGDIYALQNKNEEARLAYQEALAESDSTAIDPNIVNMKLSSLK